MNADDYRASHLSRGPTYDQTLGENPLDSYMDRWEIHHLTEIVAQLFPAGIARYLDFACGTGRITHHVEPSCGLSYGIDVSESMLSVARARCKQSQFACIDLTRSDWAEDSFDLVTSFRFFGNAQDELRESALQAIFHRLKPGGYLIVNNHRNPGALMTRPSTARVEQLDLTNAKFARLLGRTGFDVVDRRAIGMWIMRPRLATRAHLESKMAERLERWFSNSLFSPLAPDTVVVARKPPHCTPAYRTNS